MHIPRENEYISVHVSILIYIYTGILGMFDLFLKSFPGQTSERALPFCFFFLIFKFFINSFTFFNSFFF